MASQGDGRSDKDAVELGPRGRGSDVGADIRAIGKLLPYLWPRGERDIRLRVVAALVFLVGAKLAIVCVPILYKQAVDTLSGEGGAAIALPVGLIVAYGLIRLASSAFNELRDLVFARVSQRAIRKVALEVFGHLHALALRFHLDRRTGGLSRAIERGVKAIEFLLSFTLFNILPTLIEIALVSGILWSLYDWRYAALTFLTIAGYIAFTLVVTEWRIKFRREMNETDSLANTRAIDSLLNFETVKYFGNEAHETHRYDQALRRYENAAVLSRTSLSMLNVGQGGLIAGGLIALMTMAAAEVVAGTMTIGDFVLVNSYLLQLAMPLNFLGFVYREIKQALIDMESMFRLLDVEKEVADRPGAGVLGRAAGDVAFEDVVFGYDADRPILKGVSFHVPAGGTLAIVGPSGSGKSTVARLMFRFYDVDAGRILVDDQDIREVTQESLRANIGIVPQDTVLFNDTIYYNIAYGRPGAAPSEVEAAARHARIHDFVMRLPAGYETTVGERGLKLSGGEKQRVAIARTILKDPPVLVLDEATSALDTGTEKAIQASLADIARGRTTVIIAHRLSTVVDSDAILVMNNGEIIEEGDHRHLMAMDGAYATMWKQQERTLHRDSGGATKTGAEPVH